MMRRIKYRLWPKKSFQIFFVAALLIALVCWVTQWPPETSFCFLSGAASVGTLGLFWKLCSEFDLIQPKVRMPALLLLFTHSIFIRGFAFPQSDAVLMLCITSVLFLALIRYRRKAAWQLPIGVLLMTVGLLQKLSFLPAIALFPLACVWRWRGRIHSISRIPAIFISELLTDTLVFTGLPLLLFYLFQSAFNTHDMYAHELSQRSTQDSTILNVLEATLHSFIFLFPLAYLGRKCMNRTQGLLLSWILFYLASLWIGQASGWIRFYLVLIPPAVLLAGRGLEWIYEKWGITIVWITVMLYSILNCLMFRWNLVF